MAISNLLTGRVRVVSPKNVTSDRYQFLDLSQAEPNLGVPAFSASLIDNPAIVISDSDGNRGFIQLPKTNQITSGSVTASVDANNGFVVTSVASGSQFTGSMNVSGSITLSKDGFFVGDGSQLTNVLATVAPRIASGSVTASIAPDTGLVVNTSASIQGDLTVANNLYVSHSIFAEQLIVSLISSSIIYSSGSNIFGNKNTDTQQFTGSVRVQTEFIGNYITGSSFTGSFTGSFFGDAANLFNLPQANRLASGSVTASVTPNYGFKVESNNSGSQFTGSVNVSGSVTAQFYYGDGSNLLNVPSTVAPRIASGSATASISPNNGLEINTGVSINDFLIVTGSAKFYSSLSASMFTGSGKGLFDIPQSALSGDSPRIASGSATASISPDKGLIVNTSATISGSILVSGSAKFNNNVSASMFTGSGAGLYDIPRSALTPDALKSVQISSGSVTASVDPSYGFKVESSKSGSQFTGSVNVSGNISVASGSYFSGSGEKLFNIPKSALTNDALLSNLIVSGSVTASVTPEYGFKVVSVESGSQFTGSLNVSGSISASFFKGDGSQLTNIPTQTATQIVSGSVTASVAPDYGFKVNAGAQFSGSVRISGSVYVESGSYFVGDGSKLTNIV